jgi:stalled ribosome alternative rescue factor ArfA
MVFYALDDQHITSLFRQTLQHVEEERSRTTVGSREGSYQREAAHARREATSGRRVAGDSRDGFTAREPGTRKTASGRRR